MSRFLLCGGGTGGHLTPALAVGHELERRGHEVGYVTLGRAIEERFVPGGTRRYGLRAERPGEQRCRRLRLLVRMPSILAQTTRILDEFRPDAVMGTGGLAAFFPLRAALRRRVPGLLLEVNARAGQVTRRLGPRVAAVLCGFEESARELAARGARTRTIGVPLRAEFDADAVVADRTRFGLPPTGRVVAVLGGSQGARALNRIAAALAPRWCAAGHHLVHATGATDRAEMQERARGLALTGTWSPREFVEEVPALLGIADLVLARAGASTVAEIAAMGRASVLFPYPHHRDRHQLANALQLGGGARPRRDALGGRGRPPGRRTARGCAGPRPHGVRSRSSPSPERRPRRGARTRSPELRPAGPASRWHPPALSWRPDSARPQGRPEAVVPDRPAPLGEPSSPGCSAVRRLLSGAGRE